MRIEMNAEPPENVMQDWARRTLGLSADAGISDRRALLMKRISEDGFVPTEEWDCALRVLERASPPRQDCPPQISRWLEDEYSTKLDDFRTRFFDLPIPERVKAWEELLLRADRPRLRARLKALNPGLRVNIGTVRDADLSVAELASRLGQLFVAHDASRPQLRRTILMEMVLDPRRWRNTARRLRRTFPKVAALDPLLLVQIKSLSLRCRMARRFERERRVTGILLRSLRGAGWILLLMIWLGIIVGSLSSKRDRSKPPSNWTGAKVTVPAIPSATKERLKFNGLPRQPDITKLKQLPIQRFKAEDLLRLRSKPTLKDPKKNAGKKSPLLRSPPTLP